MAFTPPPLKGSPHLLCDWIEFQALSNHSGEFRLSTLKRMWDVGRETEESDPGGDVVRELDTDVSGVSGADEDVFMDSLFGEFGERMEALGGTYPFEITKTNRLRVVGPPNDGGYMYLFCLLLTYSNAKEILDRTWMPNVDNGVRDLFQACSTLAAAGEVRGCAISFGWPRPAGNPPFLKKLKEVYRILGEGEVVDKPRKGVSPAVKDEEIDLIAWRPRPDRAAGTEYLLGQVASGDNWMGKSILGGPINNFHRNWFSHIPASAVNARASMFIPHSVPPIDTSGTRRERLNIISATFGTIIDRLRLPLLAQQGLDLCKSSAPGIHIERHEDMPKIHTWVIDQIVSLQRITA